MSITPHFLVLLLCGAAAAGFVNGLAGFGTALFALGFWLQIMSPTDAVSLVLVMSIVSGVPGMWMVRKTIAAYPVRLARFALPALAGIPIGVASLSLIEPKWLKLGIAGFLIVYGSFFIVRKNLPTLSKPTPIADTAVGFFGGILGGAAGLAGVLPTIWCAMRPWPKEQTRAVIQTFNTLVFIVAASLLALKGVFDTDSLIHMAITFPVTLLFTYIGMSVFRQLKDEHFRRLLVVLLFLAGVILSLRELFF